MQRVLVHLRSNIVAYVALFVALGGSSYAAVRLAPNSVTTRTIAKGAVTNAKLAKGAVTTSSVRNGTLASTDFGKGQLLKGLRGDVGNAGSEGNMGLAGIPGLKGDAGPAGQNGSASIALKARSSGSVSAANSASTSIPLSGNTWTQSAGELDLITGNVTVGIPASCTGSFGNAVVISVDGNAQTFAVAPSSPASRTVTVPVNVGTLSEPGGDATHTLTAAVANSCTKGGENYAVSNARFDVLAFR
ncbi:collagen-like triple helix repeat-containing protein [Candidatus Solirubrobacter pratensis]|uniref:collagen-like triple helix repeat-containing protein n=1 Tax=Candidatus Solirubrobacter pratensis TaxID=1298857 RepID=UPI0018C9534E|nr:collagen-like protein [Candidatus Solirubrobacter pratensis]